MSRAVSNPGACHLNLPPALHVVLFSVALLSGCGAEAPPPTEQELDVGDLLGMSEEELRAERDALIIGGIRGDRRIATERTQERMNQRMKVYLQDLEQDPDTPFPGMGTRPRPAPRPEPRVLGAYYPDEHPEIADSSDSSGGADLLAMAVAGAGGLVVFFIAGAGAFLVLRRGREEGPPEP